MTGSKLEEGPSLVLALLPRFLVTWVCLVCQNASGCIICAFLYIQFNRRLKLNDYIVYVRVSLIVEPVTFFKCDLNVDPT